jgi:hypothetical protein
VSDAPAEIEFLTVEVVIALHQRLLERFGGGAGLRDRGLLESAVAQPQASFGGTYVHEGLFAMASPPVSHRLEPSVRCTNADKRCIVPGVTPGSVTLKPIFCQSSTCSSDS